MPGGPNDFHIRALDGRNQPATATVTARVRDSKKNQLYEQVLGKKNGDFDLRLPLDLPLGQSDVVLEVDASGDSGSKSELREQLPLALPQLLTHLTTDKPLYRPGETVRFRSLTLDRLSLKPPPDELQLDFVVTDPDQAERSIARGPTRLYSKRFARTRTRQQTGSGHHGTKRSASGDDPLAFGIPACRRVDGWNQIDAVGVEADLLSEGTQEKPSPQPALRTMSSGAAAVISEIARRSGSVIPRSCSRASQRQLLPYHPVVSTAGPGVARG